MESFEVRKKALFDCLSQAEGTLKGTNLDQSKKRVHESDVNILDNVPERKISKLRGKESIFVKPDLPITKCLKPRRQPDYQVNPHKWKKYSLADADISDKSNSDAAFTFLREIAAQKEKNTDVEDEETGDKKIVFNKPVRSSLKADIVDTAMQSERPEMKGSKVVMPEYVVGQKAPKVKKTTSCKPRRGSEKGEAVKLDHLFDE